MKYKYLSQNVLLQFSNDTAKYFREIWKTFTISFLNQHIQEHKAGIHTYYAPGEISGHELEEADLGHIHVLPVAALLPLPAALTPLLNHLQNPIAKHCHHISQPFVCAEREFS